MKIFLATERLSARGGAERHLVALLKRLAPGHETRLAVGWDDGSLPLAEQGALGPWFRLKGLDRGGLSLRGGQAAARRLVQALDDFQPDVVHLQNVMDPALIQAAAATGRAVVTVQDHRFFCPGQGKVRFDGRLCDQVMGRGCEECFGDKDYGQAMLKLTRRRLAALGGSRRVLALSQYMAGELRRAGLMDAKVELIPPMVDGLALPRGPGRGAYHLLACRLVERKGVLVALKAARRLKGKTPLVVAGDGPLAGAVRRAAKMRKGGVVFAGWAGRARMGRLLANARSLWLPSLWAEPYGIVGVEALFSGVPVVASQCGGVAEWMGQGEHGVLVAPGDAAALARAADYLAGHADRARAMGRTGQKWVERHLNADRLMARLQGVYDEVAGVI